MAEIKEIPKVKENGEKKKLSRAELILQVEREIADIVKMYHQRVGYLSGLKEGN